MFRGRERRFSSAHAIAIAALFFALGGGAYAAVTSLPPNSVGTRQLQNGSVTAAKLAHSGVQALSRLNPRQKKELKKLIKAYSKPSPAGPQGPKGGTGAPGPSNVYIGGAAAGSLSNSYGVVTSISVPPGQYLLQAKTTIAGTSASAAGAASCFLGTGLSPSEVWDGGSVAFPASAATLTAANLSLAGAASFESEHTVALVCKTLDGEPIFDDARVWATKVGSVQGLPVPID
jgi:hypothetical protein